MKNILLIILSLLLLPLITKSQEEREVDVIQVDLKKADDSKTKANLLLELALAYVHKPGEEKIDLDTALLLIKQAENINNKVLHDRVVEARTYLVYSNAYRERGDTAVGHQYINKAVDAYENLSLPTDLGNAYLEITSYYNEISKKNVPYVLQCSDSALKQFKLSGNQERQALTLKKMADWNILIGNYGKALGELKEALNIYKANHTKNIQDVYDLLNLVNINLGDYPTAIENGLLAEQASLQTKDSGMGLCTIYYRLALVYNKWTNYNSTQAADYYIKALNIALRNKDYPSIQFITVALCYQFVNLHQPAKAITLIHKLGNNIQFNNWADSFYIFSGYLPVYVEAKQLDKARFYADYLVKILADTTKDFIDEQPDLAYKSLVTYFINTHQYQLAEKYANINLAFSRKNTNRALVAVAYNYKARADSAVGDFKSALENYRLANVINDSIFNDNKAFQFAQMQVAFNTKQKEDSLKINQQNIQMLSAKNKADLKKADLTRNIIIISAISLLMILFAGYQLKQNNNKKLQAKQKEINQQNKTLTQTLSEKNKLLQEKEWLVKEIHHRVKNNLQIVISLLSTQSKYLDNEEAIAAISESSHRMQAMSLIHQKLYQSENTTLVNMQTYITELSDYLKTSFNSGKEINFLINVDAVELDISQAIPVGLILNEVITNAIKYAFEDREAGNIRIKMLCIDEAKILLEIKDNGIGLPDDFYIQTTNSMGMRLIKGLVKQINGNLLIANDSGVKMVIDFKTENIFKI